MSHESLIHIGFLIDQIGSSPGGTEKQLLTLIHNLSPHRFRLSLYVLRDSDFAEHWVEPCKLQVMHVTSLKNPSTISKLARLRQSWVRDKVHVLQTHFMDSNLVGIPLGLAAGIPHLITTRRGQTPRPQSTAQLQRAVNRLTHLVIVNSFSTKRWVMDVEGVPEEKIRVVYNAIDVDRYSTVDAAVRSRLRSELNIENAAVVVGLCANLRPIKSIDTFLRAAAVVATSLPKTRFVVVGEDENGEEARLRKLSRDLGVAESVRFLGPRKDVPDLLSVMNVGVLSSQSESMPNSVVEYMAAGLPVVATDVGGVFRIDRGRCQWLHSSRRRWLRHGSQDIGGSKNMAEITAPWQY